jgi:D-alanyl-D-alanine carboxypeptidase
MVTRFTSQARTVIAAAEQEARASRSSSLEAEHVLLAISTLDDVDARPVLSDVGLDHAAIERALKDEVLTSLSTAGIDIDPARLPQATADPSRRIRFGTSAKASLRRAAGAAAGTRQIKPGHLLLGVLEAEHGTVPRALAIAGFDRVALVERVRSAIDSPTP